MTLELIQKAISASVATHADPVETLVAPGHTSVWGASVAIRAVRPSLSMELFSNMPSIYTSYLKNSIQMYGGQENFS